MKKREWNIWNIKNRHARAAVAWLFAGAIAVLALTALPIAMVWLAVVGVIDGVRAFAADHEWRSLWSDFWRAATAEKETTR